MFTVKQQLDCNQSARYWNLNEAFLSDAHLKKWNDVVFPKDNLDEVFKGILQKEQYSTHNIGLCVWSDDTVEPTTESPTTSEPTSSPTVHIYVMNGNYIYTTEPALTFVNAQRFCRNKFGTSLATIFDQQDVDSAISLITSENEHDSPWIGLYSTHNVGWWVWIDKTECVTRYGSCAIGSFWRDGQPKCLKQNENGHNCTNLGTLDFKFDNDIKCEEPKTFLCNSNSKENSNAKALIDVIFNDKHNDKNDNNNYHGLDKWAIFRISVLCIIIFLIILILCVISSKKLLSFFRKRLEEKYQTVKCIEYYCDNSDDTSDELDEILADSV